MLSSSTTLRQSVIKREPFDPKNKTHLESLDMFLATGNWGKVQFFAEYPHTDVPKTVLTKFAEHARKVKRT